MISMGEIKMICQNGIVTKQSQWVLMKSENDHDQDRGFETIDSDSDFEESSDDDTAELGSSSSSSSSSSYGGPLYELSELMSQLPIKRGLSKYYQGQSQSFGSLANVKSLEDLAKKGDFISYNKRMKPITKSSGNSKKYGPKPTIAKKTSRAKRESANLVGSLIRSSQQKHF